MRNQFLQKAVYYAVIFALIICGLVLIFSLFGCENKPTKKELHQKQIESLFYYRGGPHKTAFSLVSKMANDPKSIENLDCVYIEDTINHTLDVHWDFTYKNAFGGVVREQIVFQSDTLGNVIKFY